MAMEPEASQEDKMLIVESQIEGEPREDLATVKNRDEAISVMRRTIRRGDFRGAAPGACWRFGILDEDGDEVESIYLDEDGDIVDGPGWR